MKLYSNFAIVDVEHGRKALFKHLEKDFKDSVEVVLKGKLVGAYGCDDGMSMEFEMEVASIDVLSMKVAGDD